MPGRRDTGTSAGQTPGDGARHALDQGPLLKLLGYQLAQASIPTSRAFRKHIGRLGLTQAEYTVLTLLAINEDVTQVQIGRVLGAAASNLTNLLVRLEAKGLIVRRRSAVDARAQTITLSRAGAVLARRAATESSGMEDHLLRHLSDGERSILFELLQKVARLRHP